MEFLALYSAKCKSCGHLDPEEDRKYNKCHFSSGNTECPAQEVQFAVVGEAKRLASTIKKARATKDLAKEIEILTLVEARSPAFQQKFREWLAK